MKKGENKRAAWRAELEKKAKAWQEIAWRHYNLYQHFETDYDKKINEIQARAASMLCRETREKIKELQ